VSLGLVALLMGCSSSGGGAPYTPRDNEYPVVSEFSITPPNNGWRAGACQIQLRATDNVAVASVVARINGPDSSGDAVPLSLTPGSGGLYQGSGTVPANSNSNGQVNTYYVTAWAQDKAGNSTPVASSLTLSVPAPDGPVPPPEW